ncbi:MAG: hypothetical protein J1F22_01835 [Lachnospiraceae bacterium]|nr:hypothetical protein [Lachnospiraceae bacterium]
MNNAIYVDYMTRTYQNFLKSYEARTEVDEDNSFVGAVNRQLESRNARTNGVSTVAFPVVISPKDMTLEQYKQYIHDKISQIPLHPSQMQNSISIHISDEGFEAMKNDPEYEKWVLDTLKANFSFHDPWANMCGGSYSIHYFGATKEEYHGHGWYKGYQNGKGESLFDKKAEDSFWERRARRKKLLKALQEKSDARKRQLSEMENRMFETELYNRSLAERARIRGVDMWNPGRHMESLSMSYETGLLLDLLMMGSGGFFM